VVRRGGDSGSGGGSGVCGSRSVSRGRGRLTGAAGDGLFHHVHLGKQVVDIAFNLGLAVIQGIELFLNAVGFGIAGGLRGRIVGRNVAFFNQFRKVDDLFVSISGVLGNHASPQ